MKICVLVKQVPSKDSILKISDDHLSLVKDELSYITNESDNYALEEALLMKEAHGGEVVVCTLGEESALQVIKDALAKGADRGIFVSDPQFTNLDTLANAKLFSVVLKEENFDLIFSGLQSDDSGNAQLGLLIAEILVTSHASLVMGTEMIGDSVIKVKKELEGGWFQWAELELPASITVQSGLNKPRYASLRGIMMMKKKPITTLTAFDIRINNLSPKSHVKGIYTPNKTKETTIIDGSTEEIVSQLMEKFENDIQVIG